MICTIPGSAATDSESAAKTFVLPPISPKFSLHWRICQYSITQKAKTLYNNAIHDIKSSSALISENYIMPTLRRHLERGQGLVEYALILSLAAVVIIIVLSLMGNQVAVKMCDVVIDLGGTAPDSIQACRAPRVTFAGSFSSPLNVEAVVKNNHGLMKSNLTVAF